MPPDRPHVRVDPAQRWGQPAVKGISVDAIVGMVLAGEGVATVAYEYDLTRSEVLVACWHAGLYGDKRHRRLWKAWARDVAGPVLWKAEPALYDTIPDPPVPERPA